MYLFPRSLVTFAIRMEDVPVPLYKLEGRPELQLGLTFNLIKGTGRKHILYKPGLYLSFIPSTTGIGKMDLKVK